MALHSRPSSFMASVALPIVLILADRFAFTYLVQGVSFLFLFGMFVYWLLTYMYVSLGFR